MIVIKSRQKKLCKLIILILLFSVCCNLFAGCEREELEFGYFKYIKDYDNDYVDITGLTEEGAKQKILIVPKEINGIHVRRLMYDGGMLEPKIGEWESNALEKVFIDHGMNMVQGLFADCPNMKSLILINYSMTAIYDIDGYFGEEDERFCYVNPVDYSTLIDPLGKYKPANVVFDFNYENSLNNGAYWLDNVNYGEKIEIIPEIPTRTDFSFDGWYKEPECINIWNFETDVLPEQILDSDNKVTYQETKLYAKWI
jgi:hypothetical protein